MPKGAAAAKSAADLLHRRSSSPNEADTESDHQKVGYRRTAAKMEVIRKIFGELENNCYIIYDRDGGEAYIIDPGYEAAKIADLVSRRRFRVKGILATHYHQDHTGACDELRQRLGVKVFMNRRDARRYRGTVDVFLKEGDILKLGEEEFRVIETPGHTSGSISLSLSSVPFLLFRRHSFPHGYGICRI